MKNNPVPVVIVGQGTNAISDTIEEAAIKNVSFPFVFARAGNNKAYNKSKGKKKSK